MSTTRIMESRNQVAGAVAWDEAQVIGSFEIEILSGANLEQLTKKKNANYLFAGD